MKFNIKRRTLSSNFFRPLSTATATSTDLSMSAVCRTSSESRTEQRTTCGRYRPESPESGPQHGHRHVCVVTLSRVGECVGGVAAALRSTSGKGPRAACDWLPVLWRRRGRKHRRGKCWCGDAVARRYTATLQAESVLLPNRFIFRGSCFTDTFFLNISYTLSYLIQLKYILFTKLYFSLKSVLIAFFFAPTASC